MLEEKGMEDTQAVLRLEELNPFPFAQLQRVLGSYSSMEQLVWAQEEPLNAGAWFFVQPHLIWALRAMGKQQVHVKYVGRPSLPAPAMGLSKDNAQQHVELMEGILGSWK
jgi:2-oxoglutarate dehydrogenase complex dehydrogenase (E1) component-like enzyme